MFIVLLFCATYCLHSPADLQKWLKIPTTDPLQLARHFREPSSLAPFSCLTLSLINLLLISITLIFSARLQSRKKNSQSRHSAPAQPPPIRLRPPAACLRSRFLPPHSLWSTTRAFQVPSPTTGRHLPRELNSNDSLTPTQLSSAQPNPFTFSHSLKDHSRIHNHSLKPSRTRLEHHHVTTSPCFGYPRDTASQGTFPSLACSTCINTQGPTECRHHLIRLLGFFLQSFSVGQALSTANTVKTRPACLPLNLESTSGNGPVRRRSSPMAMARQVLASTET